MKQVKFFFWQITTSLILLMCAACGGTSDQSPPSPETVFTAAAKTVEARLTQTANAAPPSATPQPTSPATATSTSTPAALPTSAIVKVTQSSSGAATNICDVAMFVKEEIPDGSTFKPGETFTKKWTIKNIGTCTWTKDYKVVFSSGDKMGAEESYDMPEAVKSLESIAIAINMKAPAKTGEYRGDWKLENASGTLFGVNPNDASFWVKIKVAGTAATSTEETEATNTSAPATNTSAAPTNTTAPPTNTTVPPTNTTVPPTATLEPTAADTEASS